MRATRGEGYWNGSSFGESAEDARKRQEAEAEAERKKQEVDNENAEKAEQAYALMGDEPGLVAECVVDDGKQTEIDLDRYHDWLEKQYGERAKREVRDKLWHERGAKPSAEDVEAAMSGKDYMDYMPKDVVEAVLQADQAIRTFNSKYSEEQRAKYLETGDVSVLVGKTSDENLRKAEEEGMSFLREEGFFVEREDGSLKIDPDFAKTELIGVGAKESTLRENLPREWLRDRFSAMSEAEKAQFYWDAGGEEKYGDKIPANLRQVYEEQAKKYSELRDAWYENLPEGEREKLTEKRIAEMTNDPAEAAKRRERLAKDENLAKRVAWLASEDKSRFGDLTDEQVKMYEHADLEIWKAKTAWRKSLSAEKRTEMHKSAMAEYTDAIKSWNEISEEQRRKYLQNGVIGELVVKDGDGQKAEEITAGSKEGQKTVEMLVRLQELGAIKFGVKEKAVSELNAETQAFDERLQTIVSDETRDKAARYDEETAKTSEKEQAFIDKHDKFVETVKRNRGEQIDELIANSPELFSSDLDEAKNEAAYLLTMKGDEGRYAYEMSMLKMKRRQEHEAGLDERRREALYANPDERETIEVDTGDVFEKEAKSRFFVMDQETWKTKVFSSKKEADAEMAKLSNGVMQEYTLDGIDIDNPDDDAVIDQMKTYYYNRFNTGDAERDRVLYERELKGMLDKMRSATEKRDAENLVEGSDRKARKAMKELASHSKGLQEYLKAQGVKIDKLSKAELTELRDKYMTETPEGKREYLEDELRGKKGEQMRKILGRDPEADKKLSEMSDEEVSGLLMEVDNATKTTDALINRMKNEPGFREYVLTKAPTLENINAQMELNVQASERLLSSYDDMMTGDLLAISSDVSGDSEKSTKELGKKLYEADLAKRGRFGRFWRGKVRANHYEKLYRERAEKFLETGDKDKLGKGVKNADELLKGYWEGRSKTEAFEEAYHNDMPIMRGEKMSVYGIRLEGDKRVVYRQDGAERIDLEDNEANHDKIDATLKLAALMETYANSDGGEAAKRELQSGIDAITESLNGETAQFLRVDNFAQTAEAARQRMKFGRSQESLVAGFRFIDAEGGRSATRKHAIDILKQRRAEERPVIEKMPRLELSDVADLTSSLEQAMVRMSETGLSDDEKVAAKEQLIGAIANAKMREEHGLVRWGVNEDSEKSALEALIARADEQTGEITLGADEEYSKDIYGDKDWRIKINRERMNELSGGNPDMLAEAIDYWNTRGNRHKFDVMMSGHEMSSYDLLLVAAGLVHPTVRREAFTNSRGEYLVMQGGHPVIPKRGLTAESLSSTIEVPDSSINSVLHELESSESAEEIRSAIETWNTLPEIQRRLYLNNEDANLDDETKRVGSILEGVFIERPRSYGRTLLYDKLTHGYNVRDFNRIAGALDLRKSDGSGELVDAEDFNTSARSWYEMLPTQRIWLIGNSELNGESGTVSEEGLRAAGISNENVAAYKMLKEMGIVGPFMLVEDEDVAPSSTYGEVVSVLPYWTGLSREDREVAIDGMFSILLNDSGEVDVRRTERERERAADAWRKIAALGITRERALAM